MSDHQGIEINFAFWFHLAITIIAWFLPFMAPWQIALPIFFSVVLQHAVLKSCILNKHHAVDDSSGNDTFYYHILRMAGFELDPYKVKVFARKILYPMLGAITIIWQIVLGHAVQWW